MVSCSDGEGIVLSEKGRALNSHCPKCRSFYLEESILVSTYNGVADVTIWSTITINGLGLRNVAPNWGHITDTNLEAMWGVNIDSELFDHCSCHMYTVADIMRYRHCIIMM